jgi:hypothetical protein
MITSRFRARGTNGVVYAVLCYEPDVNTTNLQSQARESMSGMPEYRLEDGRSLKAIDANTFEIREGGERLTRIS